MLIHIFIVWLSLSSFDIQGKKLKVSASQAKNKLFIGNIPRTWTDDDLKKVVTNIGPGVEFIELVKVSFIYFIFSINSGFKIHKARYAGWHPLPWGYP